MIDGPVGGRGKWSQRGVPHRGWTCVNVEDLGAPNMRCEMCEAVDIRYVHYMHHSQYQGLLSCGEICAGHMEGDLVNANKRDKTMKSVARKRKAFPNRKSWYQNRNGNPQIEIDGFRVTIFKKSTGWGGVVRQISGNKSAFTREHFEQPEDAKLASFDTFVFLNNAR